MKSPLSRGSAAPHVHPRLRKRLARCTLDCGFKTPESPALRGFVAERCPIRGTSLYLVLKSNGLHHSKNPACKVRFFAQNRSRKYRQKVTATTLFQTASYSDFQLLAQTAHVCFHGRKRVHTRLSEKDRTQAAHTPKQGAFRMGVVSLLSERSARSPTSPGRVSERQVLPLLGLGRGCSQRTQKAFGTAMRLCASLFRGVAAPLGCVICLQLADVAVFSLCAQYFLNVRGGGGITTLGAFHTVRKPCVARVSERQTLPLLGLGRGCSRRTQKAFGTAMRLCASLFRRRRGPAGLRDLFCFCQNCGLYTLRSGAFRVCETWEISLPSACSYVLLKRRTAACQNSSFAVF